MQNRLLVSSSPHIRSKETIQTVMRDVLIALTPAALYGAYSFGLNALMLILVCMVTCMATEWLIVTQLRKNRSPIGDLSAAVTGLLLAMNLPSTAPWWIAVIGSVFAIAIAKQVFGGIGHNFMNPALAARVLLLNSWSARMTGWVAPGVDAVSTVTPLGVLGEGGGDLPSMFDVFIGNIGGSLGETSALLLIVGGIYLLYRGVITWHIPVIYIATSFVFAFLFYGFNIEMAVYQLLIGGLMMGAIFMATDYASSPVNTRGQIIYAFGAGLLTMLIRRFGPMPEGVSFAIIIMNVGSPIIEKYTKPKIFGGVK